MEQIQLSAGRVIALRARWPQWAPSVVDVSATTPAIEIALTRR